MGKVHNFIFNIFKGKNKKSWLFLRTNNYFIKISFWHTSWTSPNAPLPMTLTTSKSLCRILQLLTNSSGLTSLMEELNMINNLFQNIFILLGCQNVMTPCDIMSINITICCCLVKLRSFTISTKKIHTLYSHNLHLQRNWSTLLFLLIGA